MNRIRRFASQYITAMLFLWSAGERAWPWNVRFVWSHVGTEYSFSTDRRSDN